MNKWIFVLFVWQFGLEFISERWICFFVTAWQFFLLVCVALPAHKHNVTSDGGCVKELFSLKFSPQVIQTLFPLFPACTYFPSVSPIFLSVCLHLSQGSLFFFFFYIAAAASVWKCGISKISAVMNQWKKFFERVQSARFELRVSVTVALQKYSSETNK